MLGCVYTKVGMPLNIRNKEGNRLAETLAKRKHIDKTEVVKLARQNELKQLDKPLSVRERLQPLQDRVASYGSTGLEADKAVYDSLYVQ